MEKEKKEIPSAVYNFHGNVGPLIHHVDTLNMTIDKDMNVHIQGLEELNSQQPTYATAPQPTAQTPDIDPSALIFKPNEQNRPAIESLLKETLTISTKKSVICKKLYKQRALFNLHAQDDTTKANIINAWGCRFGLNFKKPFTRQDFYAYYCE